MGKIRLGVLGTADIAFRRFLPALQKSDCFEYVGVASRTVEKTEVFIQNFGGKGFFSYQELLGCAEIDAVYIPLPPALHYEWAKKALEHGKHVLMEKPFTTALADTETLIQIAEEKGLTLHENYMFQYHSQLRQIKQIVASGELGEVRLYRIAFGFPKREENDFRYQKILGGGALLDCGGYTIKLASLLLGETARITTSQLNYVEAYEVDLFGSATMENIKGEVAQLSFGMDNCYKCDLEIWGSTGNLYANRIFTAPFDYTPEIIIQKGNEKKSVRLESDDTFLKSIKHFSECITEEKNRLNNYQDIRLQATLVKHMNRGAK